MLEDTITSIDPAFAYPAGGSLHVHPAADPQSVWRHLSSLVARDPLDLESQVRRVVQAVDNGDATHAWSALIDLFLALGPRCRSLRSDMLDRARPLLAPEDVDFLRRSLDAGLLPGADLPLGSQSILDAGLIGHVGMIRHERVQAVEQSVAEQAAALLDQGDLDAARSLLEDALVQNPDDEAVSRELLAIYRHSRDNQAVAAMRDRLTARHGKVPASWA